MTAGKEVSTPGRDGTSTPGCAGPAPPGEFRLDPASGVPAYLQLVQQVEHALRLGRLRTGDQLPAVKELTASLKINPDTMLKAYKELELARRFSSQRNGSSSLPRATGQVVVGRCGSNIAGVGTGSCFQQTRSSVHFLDGPPRTPGWYPGERLVSPSGFGEFRAARCSRPGRCRACAGSWPGLLALPARRETASRSGPGVALAGAAAGCGAQLAVSPGPIGISFRPFAGRASRMFSCTGLPVSFSSSARSRSSSAWPWPCTRPGRRA